MADTLGRVPDAKCGSNAFLRSTGEKLNMNQYWYSGTTIGAMVDEIQAQAKRAAFLSTPSVYFSLTDERLRANSVLFDFDEVWASDPGFQKYDYKHPELIPAELHHTFDYVVIDPPFITEEVWVKYAQAALLLLVQQPDRPNAYGEHKMHTADVGDVDALFGTSKSSTSSSGAATGEEEKTEVETASGKKDPFDDPDFNPFASSSKTRVDSVSGRDVRLEIRTGPDCMREKWWTPENELVCKDVRGKIMLTTIVENDWLLLDLLGVRPRRFRPSIPNLIYQYSFFFNYPTSRFDELNEEIDQTDPPGTSRKPSPYAGFGNNPNNGGGTADHHRT